MLLCFSFHISKPSTQVVSTMKGSGGLFPLPKSQSFQPEKFVNTNEQFCLTMGCDNRVILFTEFVFKSQKFSVIKEMTFAQILAFRVFLQLLGQNPQTCYNNVKINNKRKAMNALKTDCQKKPLKITSNEIKCISHFKLWSKFFLAIRYDYHVSELCWRLHALCIVVPATILFQTIQQVS